MKPVELNFDDKGLIPAIVQDIETGQVLMMAYMNADALEKTNETGLATFYSRSRKSLWTKGETSGNTMKMVDIQKDCDADTLLVRVIPSGPACHTGNTSCFYEKEYSTAEAFGFLKQLEDLLRRRKVELPEGSYTSRMFAAGLDKIAQKVGEEAVETVIASKNPDDEAFIYEASDLLFHLLLLAVEKEIPFTSLVRELERRHGK